MGREIQRLSARKVATLTRPGRHADGAGLYLVVDKSLAKRWVFLFRWNGKLKEMGLGGVNRVPLARVRELASDARRVLAGGQNPIAVRRQEPRSVPTFGELADEYVETMKPQFRNEKHIAQWSMTLKEYAAPLRAKPVDAIGTDDVLAVLKPIWSIKPETASRLRGRIERVLSAAKAKGFRTGENPALWRGHLSNLLPKRHRLTRGHHKAMPFADLPTFVANLRQRRSAAALALELTILTAARSGEIRGAVWSEFDLDARVWTIPAGRMKAGREHRVALSIQAVNLVKGMAVGSGEPTSYVFPGSRPGKPLSVMAMDMMLRRLGVDVTVHGFRSSFRDWAGECTNFSRELAETALAHVIGDATERAYRRGDAIEPRRELMQSWADFCCGDKPGVANVLSG